MIPSRLLFGFSTCLLALALCGCQRHEPPVDAPAGAPEATPDAGEISPRRVH